MAYLTEHSQVVFSPGVNIPSPSDERMTTRLLLLPAYASAFSAVVMLLHVVIGWKRVLRTLRNPTSDSAVHDHSKGTWRQHITDMGKVTFAYKFFRLDATAAAFSLVVYTANEEKWSLNALAAVATAAYTVLLAVVNVCAMRRYATLASTHLTFIAFTILLIYSYRDLWPLLTFTLRPADGAQGTLLWAKIGLWAFIGVLEPVLEPYPYVAINSKDIKRGPNPEQTASIASLLFYTFLDSTIWRAYRVPHLPFDDLPPLSNCDEAKTLMSRSFPYLDPFAGGRKGQLFLGLIRVFRSTLLRQSAVLVLTALARMASPVGTNRLLNYFEQDSENALVRPWVWIALIAMGPITYSITLEWYRYLSAATSVRMESIITSLVFDHALRIRLKAEVSDTVKTMSTTTESHLAEDSTTVEVSDAAVVPTIDVGIATEPDLLVTEGVKGLTEAPKSEGGGDNLIGKLNNLVTSDLDNVVGGRDFLLIMWSAPMEISLSIWFLYKVLGWSSIVGFVVMMVLVPLSTLTASYMDKVEENKMKATDARVQSVTEIMNSLRMIKLFGWESLIKEEASKKRDEEIEWIWRRRMLEILNGILNHIIPMVHMVVTYSIYTLVMKQKLNASIVFSSLGAFDVLRDHVHEVFYMIPGLIRANVSLRRIADFLLNVELLDRFTEKTQEDPAVSSRPGVHITDIGFGASEFSWTSKSTDGCTTPSGRRFRLHIDEDLIFEKGAFNLVTGPTGSGKTSLLMALLGEMHYIPLRPGSWFNLPREEGVAYAAQESWVQNETIKDNILFGARYDEERYQKVIYQCGLKPDLKLLEAGDATEVGEKGLTLSGGQKARITLARAVYSSAQTLLLDDVLSALDTHTSRWIVNKCFKGDLMQGRTVILVTHNLALTGPIADFVVSLDHDGRASGKTSISDTSSLTIRLDESGTQTPEMDELNGQEIESKATVVNGNLTVEEEVEIGHVSRSALMLLLGGLGGDWAILFWSQYSFAVLMSEIVHTMEFWWLGWWASQYALRDQADISITYYLGVYGLIVFVLILFHIWHTVAYANATLRSSRTIHHKLITALVGSTFRWLDTTPVSRVLSRCTQDIQAVDGPVAQYLSWLVLITVSMMAKLGAVLIYVPVFLVAAIAVAAVGGYLGQIYMKAQLPVKREMAKAKSPVLGIFGGAIAGLSSIRAYGAQDAFKDETSRRLDRYVRCARTFYSLNRWISVRIDSLSALFAASLAAYFTYGSATANPSTIGFILIMAVSFSDMILWWVRIFNDFEVSANSLERIQQYTVIEQEPSKPRDYGAPSAYWPASGELLVEHLSARYSPDGPEILKDISFHIRAGERVGIVGRTGSGKSTLTLSLLRCIYTKGVVYYDGVPTHTVDLDVLRSNVTIIPQLPELLGGTLRRNLDMFGQHDDATLNDALRAAGLFSLQERLAEENRLTLDTPFASSGSNLSVGQRQIIALARAIVRQSKLLILDEATSAIDYETDAVIQASLRDALTRAVTVLTVAHRLQTIMDSDRIMVLDGGRIVEFDRPMTLVENEQSMLRALVEESADKDALYAAIGVKAKS